MSLSFRKEVNVYDNDGDYLGKIEAYDGIAVKFSSLFTAHDGAFFNTEDLREIADEIDSLNLS